MTKNTLAQSYLKKATDRLDILVLLFKKGAYSDVIREAQEIVELSLKGILRAGGIEPPKFLMMLVHFLLNIEISLKGS